jgi:hypothetical protein
MRFKQQFVREMKLAKFNFLLYNPIRSGFKPIGTNPKEMPMRMLVSAVLIAVLSVAAEAKNPAVGDYAKYSAIRYMGAGVAINGTVEREIITERPAGRFLMRTTETREGGKPVFFGDWLELGTIPILTDKFMSLFIDNCQNMTSGTLVKVSVPAGTFDSCRFHAVDSRGDVDPSQSQWMIKDAPFRIARVIGIANGKKIQNQLVSFHFGKSVVSKNPSSSKCMKIDTQDYADAKDEVAAGISQKSLISIAEAAYVRQQAICKELSHENFCSKSISVVEQAISELKNEIKTGDSEQSTLDLVMKYYAIVKNKCGIHSEPDQFDGQPKCGQISQDANNPCSSHKKTRLFDF